ncbi:MAG TPA: type II toxin-antitoxin system VapC family toxin [Alphaproteobacteria bacterium]|nr:type II toxin-antitoxin system VapC family toxin [Alphaproteobacteria bacterium]
MNLLLDTHLLLWAAGAPSRLSPTARKLIEDPAHRLWFSAASLWEITIKANLGRDDFQADPVLLRRGLLENGYNELPITSEHVIAVGRLPDLHRDPFDRVLIAQAEVEGALLLTVDERVASYRRSVRRV